MSPTPIWRPTARVLAIDPDRRLLLFSSEDQEAGVWWFTPGGGVQRGETLQAAAVRELGEETGFDCTEADLGPVVATCAGTWAAPDDRGRRYFAADSYFFLRVPAADVVADGMEDYERVVITGHRWWTVAELRAEDGHVFPHGLAGLVGRLLRGDVPSHPVRLPWTPDSP
jgi:8-oxo-dGTP pyrophosphatase MutT (NUDIX family)